MGTPVLYNFIALLSVQTGAVERLESVDTPQQRNFVSEKVKDLFSSDIQQLRHDNTTALVSFLIRLAYAFFDTPT